MSNINLDEMDDQELFAFRNEVNAAADARLAALQLRDKTKELAQQAKDLGRSPDEVAQIVDSVLNEVFDDPAEE